MLLAHHLRLLLWKGPRTLGKLCVTSMEYLLLSIKHLQNHLLQKDYVKEQGVPIGFIARGLAAGKGVVVAMNLDEALEAVGSMLVNDDFGTAGCHIVIEEYLEGEDVSFFALVDGENALPLESAQGHKRVGDGDTEPNNGGMDAH